MCTPQSLSSGIEGVVDEQDLKERFEIYNEEKKLNLM